MLRSTHLGGVLFACLVASSCLRAGLGTEEPTLAAPAEGIAAQIAAGNGDGAAAAFAALDDDKNEIAAKLAFTILDRALGSGSPAIREQAVGIVERHEIEPLADEVASLLGDASDEVAAAASVALLTSHPAAGRVASSLLESPSAEARTTVVAGIGRKVGARARGDLVAALADPDAAVRRAAVVAVGHIGDARDREALVAMATDDPKERVRAAALRALAKLPANDADIPVAQAALGDSYLGARLAAVALLAERGAMAALAEASRGSDLHVALAASVAAQKLGGPPAQPILERALQSPLWTVRVAALAAVKVATEHRQALSLAARSLVDDRAEVRLSAARTLASLGQRDRARAEFLATLETARPAPRRSAARSLVGLGDPRGAEFLASLLSDDDPQARLAAIAALANADHVPPALIAALADPTANVRLAAASTIVSITHPDF